MDTLEVRIVQLAPLHVASALGYGEGPEGQAQQKLLEWAEPRGLLDGSPRFFGFDNPMPSPGSPNYGYEIWLTVADTVTGEEEIQIKDFPGGMYAVTRCKGTENIMDTWKCLMGWLETSGYSMGRHQWLEEHLEFRGLPFEEYVLDLYLPVRK